MVASFAQRTYFKQFQVYIDRPADYVATDPDGYSPDSATLEFVISTLVLSLAMVTRNWRASKRLLQHEALSCRLWLAVAICSCSISYELYKHEWDPTEHMSHSARMLP